VTHLIMTVFEQPNTRPAPQVFRALDMCTIVDLSSLSSTV
jgi:hypothetical protein